MPKINVYLPDNLADAVKDTGVPVSAVCQRALEQSVRRITAIRAVAQSDLATEELGTRLPHFTARARTVLALAAERARADAASGIQTRHLLHGVLAEGGNLALQVLRAMEVEPAQVERDLTRQPSTEPGPDGTARLTGPAASALELAVAESIALGHDYVGSEHLLVGLATEPDGAAGQLLRSVGVEPRQARRAVVAALAGYSYVHTQPAPGLTPAEVATMVRQELRPLIERIERLEERTV